MKTAVCFTLKIRQGIWARRVRRERTGTRPSPRTPPFCVRVRGDMNTHGTLRVKACCKQSVKNGGSSGPNRGTCLGKNFESTYLFLVPVRGYVLKKLIDIKEAFVLILSCKNFDLATAVVINVLPVPSCTLSIHGLIFRFPHFFPN